MSTGSEAGAEAFLRQFAWQRGHADVWRVFADSEAFAAVVTALIGLWRAKNVTKVCGIEARGFILGGAAAYGLGVGFVAIRKEGDLFPGPKQRVEAALDYRDKRHVLEIQRQSVQAGDRVLLVDDWIERGSQAEAARQLIEDCGGELVGMAVLVDELDDEIRDALPTLTKHPLGWGPPVGPTIRVRIEPSRPTTRAHRTFIEAMLRAATDRHFRVRGGDLNGHSGATHGRGRTRLRKTGTPRDSSVRAVHALRRLRANADRGEAAGDRAACRGSERARGAGALG